MCECVCVSIGCWQRALGTDITRCYDDAPTPRCTDCRGEGLGCASNLRQKVHTAGKACASVPAIHNEHARGRGSGWGKAIGFARVRAGSWFELHSRAWQTTSASEGIRRPAGALSARPRSYHRKHWMHTGWRRTEAAAPKLSVAVTSTHQRSRAPTAPTDAGGAGTPPACQSIAVTPWAMAAPRRPARTRAGPRRAARLIAPAWQDRHADITCAQFLVICQTA